MILTAEQFDTFPFQEDKRFSVERFLRESPIGEALISENVYAISPRTRRSPDLAVILGDHYQELCGATVIPIIPELVAEVLSPSETPRMIHRKLKQYFQAGVREVWLIDPEVREIEVWTGPSLPMQALSGNAILASPLLPGFALPLKELFA